MRGLIVRWMILTAAIMLAAYTIEGIHVSGLLSAFFAAALLGVLNAFLRPVLILLTLPINILTFGLFTFVINGLLLKMASGLIPGFRVYGFWAAVFGALIISLINWLLTSFISDQGRVHYRVRGDYIDLEKRNGNKWE